MADPKEPRDDHPDIPEDDEEEEEATLTQLINQNKDLIKDLKQQLDRAKKRMMDGAS